MKKVKNKKTVTKKAPTKKKGKTVTKKAGVKKLNFLLQKKNINDKFFDLVKYTIKNVPDKNGKFKRIGVTKLAKELEIGVGTLNKNIKQGFINGKNDELFINIERNFEKLKKEKKKDKVNISSLKKQTPFLTLDLEEDTISDFKGVTKEFTIHTFTFDNFFPRKSFGKIKRDEQLYFRAGLYLVFKSGKNGTYTIQNLPISHHSNKYPEGYEEFFEIIKEKLQNHPSLKFFRFNYFDVQKINVGTIEERLQVFSKKNDKNIKASIKRKTKKNEK